MLANFAYAKLAVVSDLGQASGCPCPLAQIRAESAEQIIPFAVTTEAAFVALPAVGEAAADDRAPDNGAGGSEPMAQNIV